MERKIGIFRDFVENRPQNIRPLMRTLNLIISSVYQYDEELQAELEGKLEEEQDTRHLEPLDIRNYRGAKRFFRKLLGKYLQY